MLVEHLGQAHIYEAEEHLVDRLSSSLGWQYESVVVRIGGILSEIDTLTEETSPAKAEI